MDASIAGTFLCCFVLGGYDTIAIAAILSASVQLGPRIKSCSVHIMWFVTYDYRYYYDKVRWRFTRDRNLRKAKMATKELCKL